MFICADVAALRQHLLDMPIKQFDLVVELAYQARSMVAELEGEPHLSTGQALLREMAVWLAGAVPESERADRGTLPQAYTRVESKEQRHRREQERIAQASQQGDLVVSPDTSHGVIDAFRHWCKEHAPPYLWIEIKGRQQATLRVQTKTVIAREASTVLARFQERLPTLAASYIANAQARGYQACLSRLSRRQIALEGILADWIRLRNIVLVLFSTTMVRAFKNYLDLSGEEAAISLPQSTSHNPVRHTVARKIEIVDESNPPSFLIELDGYRFDLSSR